MYRISSKAGAVINELLSEILLRRIYDLPGLNSGQIKYRMGNLSFPSTYLNILTGLIKKWTDNVNRSGRELWSALCTKYHLSKGVDLLQQVYKSCPLVIKTSKGNKEVERTFQSPIDYKVLLGQFDQLELDALGISDDILATLRSSHSAIKEDYLKRGDWCSYRAAAEKYLANLRRLGNFLSLGKARLSERMRVKKALKKDTVKLSELKKKDKTFYFHKISMNPGWCPDAFIKKNTKLYEQVCTEFLEGKKKTSTLFKGEFNNIYVELSVNKPEAPMDDRKVYDGEAIKLIDSLLEEEQCELPQLLIKWRKEIPQPLIIELDDRNVTIQKEKWGPLGKYHKAAIIILSQLSIDNYDYYTLVDFLAESSII